MDNKEIASLFQDIADILEIKGENVFKIRAYRRASSNIAGLSRQLSDIYHEDPSEVSNIPGIGKDLAAKIAEMVTTGHLEFYSELAGEFPRGFLDLLDVGGLGPKKLKKLRDVLGVENIDELEKACRDGKVAGIEGMGEKTQSKLVQEIVRIRENEGRFLAGTAGLLADEVISYLSEAGGIGKIEKAGSLRRGVEVVGDIDILAWAGEPEKAIERFVSFPGTSEVMARGQTRASIRVRGACQVDFRIVDKQCYGAALVYFTGSKQHNVKIRHIAKKKELKLNEYGLFTAAASGEEKPVAGKTEQEVYKKLGMSWIPPELREDRGEVEAALRGELPKDLIEYGDVRGDLHLHTVDTDGQMTLEQLMRKAVEKGYEYIAVTNHSKLVRIAGGMDGEELLEHVDDIRKVARKFRQLKVLAGVEVDILKDGTLDLEDKFLKELDIVVAAIHSNFSADKETQTKRVIRAMENRYVNMLAHPSGRLITKRNALELDMDRVFRAAAENNVMLEINTHGQRVDLNDAHCMRAKEMGARFSINTDAHDTAQMDGTGLGIATARRAWLRKKDVINTYKFDELKKALKR